MSKLCKVCFEVEIKHGSRNVCTTCLPFTKQIQDEVHKIVQNRMRRGLLGPPTLFECADCGKPAFYWEHREYAFPTIVEPVCRACNIKRGPAIDLFSLARSIMMLKVTLNGTRCPSERRSIAVKRH